MDEWWLIMQKLGPKYSEDTRIARVTIVEVGPHDACKPGGTFEHTRPLYWYRVQCDCGSDPYWVNQNQLRTHRECAECYAAHAGRPAPVKPKDPPPVDFLRIPLRSEQRREDEFETITGER